MKTSYSALATYKHCPLKYKYSQIDRIRVPKRIEAVFGTLVHSALKFMFERNPLYPTLDEVIDFYAARWKEKSEKVEWAHPESQEEAKTTDNSVVRPTASLRSREEKMYFEEGVKMIKNFYKKNQPWTFNALELEGRFSLELTDEATGKVHTLAGIIDRIDKDPESEVYEIIDYKTGKKMPAQKDVETDFQLGLYHLALVHRWPHLKDGRVKTSLYFLRHNEKISATPARTTIEAMKKHVLATIAEVEKSTETGNFPPMPGPLCGSCGYRKMCPMWSHEYKREEAPAPNETEVASAIQEFFELKIDGDAQKKRVAELRDIILRYMESEQVERVFGSPGYITKSVVERTSFDIEKLEPVLKELGVWEKILEPEVKRLEKMLPTLPDSAQEAIAAFRAIKKTVMLKPTKKKGTDKDV